MKRLGIILGILVLGVLIAGSVFTPWGWHWGTSNLQIRLHNVGNERRQEGSFANSAGWAKLDFFIGDWGRRIGPGTWSGGKVTIKESTDYQIAGVSPKGVSVRVRHKEERNGVASSFDQVIFVPVRGVARVDVSPDIYLSGSFE